MAKKFRYILIAAAVAAILPFAGCKPSEKQYKQAYEATKARMEDNGGIDATIYAKMRNEARPGRYIVGNDTMPMITDRVSLAEDQGYAEFMRYNVVVGKFKQIFNARSMRDRLYGMGYLNPYIVKTREPLYYVIAYSTNNPADAVKLYKKVVENPPFAMSDPLPFVLQVEQLIRK